jgi:hypothetical protein
LDAQNFVKYLKRDEIGLSQDFGTVNDSLVVSSPISPITNAENPRFLMSE